MLRENTIDAAVAKPDGGEDRRVWGLLVMLSDKHVTKRMSVKITKFQTETLPGSTAYPLKVLALALTRIPKLVSRA
jgi:hypothetical protein